MIKQGQPRGKFEEVIHRITNIFENNNNERGITKQVSQDLKKLHQAFHTYLNEIKSSIHFPVYQGKVTNVDKRLHIYSAMMKMMSRPNKSEWSKLKAKYKKNLQTKGWPVDPNRDDYASWMKCVKEFSDIMRSYDPGLDLSAWVGVEAELSKKTEPLTKQQDSEGNASVPFETLCASKTFPQTITPLIASIKQMHAYGLELKDEDSTKAEAAISVAGQLVYSLISHYQQSESIQLKSTQEFSSNFLGILHSKDELMSAHRKPWKVIIANIIIALTGVGLIALGINYMATGHAFFNKTQSLRNVEAVDEQLSHCIN